MRFLVDRMLGKLTSWLRLLGHDTLSVNDFDFQETEDEFMITLAKEEKRILLTRDKNLVERAEKENASALLVNSDKVMDQLGEVVKTYNLDLEMDIVRCSVCNSEIRSADPKELKILVKEGIITTKLIRKYDEFWICENCGKVYWEGRHWQTIEERLNILQKKIV